MGYNVKKVKTLTYGVTDGEEVVIGGDETYEAMCYDCFKKLKGE